MLFGTTENFLRSFGVKSIEELPVINAEMIENFKEEAELEIQGDKIEQMSFDV